MTLGNYLVPELNAANVFNYTWRYELNNYDYGINLTTIVVGFVSSIILTGFTVIIKRYGKLFN